MTDELRDAAVLYALGLLEPEESDAFEQRISDDVELSELVAEYEAVAAGLSLTVEQKEPPEHIRESLFRAVQGGGAVSEKVTPIRTAGRSSFLPWAAAAAFAILSAILFVQLRESNQQLDEVVRSSSIENYRVAILDPQTDDLPEISARVAWNAATGTGILDTQDLPDPGSDRDYQLWIFDGDDPAPVSAGVFDPTVDERIVFRPDRTIGKAAAFAVSIETAGGNPQPAGPVILVGTTGAG